MQTAETPRPKRVTKRRAETRQRLLDAAGDVFAEEGFGRSTVEQVCERAGFTRGAFYSNFTSLDELFLAMWEQRSATMLDGIRTALADRPATLTLDSAVERVLAAIPVDDAWYRITAEFTAHALRNPALKRVMAARRTRSSARSCRSSRTLSPRRGDASPTARPWDGHWSRSTTAPACRC